METEPFSLEKQQRMLLRTITDIQRHIQHALETNITHDFEIIQTSVDNLKTFVRDHVTAPEIKDYTGQIKNLVYIQGSSGQFSILGFRFGISKSNREYKADRILLRNTLRIRDQLANLEILVKMMTDD